MEWYCNGKTDVPGEKLVPLLNTNVTLTDSNCTSSRTHCVSNRKTYRTVLYREIITACAADMYSLWAKCGVFTFEPGCIYSKHWI
jgi:hypothetical protein